MATAVHSGMNMVPFTQQQNQCVDPSEQDFFDFAALPSPTPQGLKRESSAISNITSPTSPSIDEDVQVPAKPSHEYDRFKQQTGIPSGSLAGLSAGYNSGFMFNSSGLDESALMTEPMLDATWNPGFSMDSNMMGMDLSQSGYMFNDASQEDFVDPSAIQQQDVPNVRVWPGMHQQQAALAKAQHQAAQQQRPQQIAHQKQQQALQQQQARLSASQPSARKTSSPLSDARTEETIARVVAQIRTESANASASRHHDADGLQTHIVRAKKDEDDMDEDERLLASEEGKKLSSKERRQLRNKVSARAFRSRRKEYIGQLEGDLNAKQAELNELRMENSFLKEENERSRNFIEMLLRHKAFLPYLDELSRDAALLTKPVIQPTAAPVMSTPAPAPFPAQQQFGGMSQPENTHVGMTMIPETPFDLSTLNLNNGNGNGNNWGAGNGFNGYQPRVFAVLELPEGPADPLDVEAVSGKGHSTIFNVEDEATEEIKPSYPVIERPVQSVAPAPAAEDDDDVPEDDLYRSSPAPSSTLAAAPFENHEQLFANPEKTLAHYSLVISDEAQEAVLAERLARRIAAAEPVFQRIAAITSMLDL